MKKLLLVLLVPFFNYAQIQIGEDIDGEAIGDQSGYSVSLSSNGTIVAIGAIGNDGNGQDSGHVRIYSYENEVWMQVGGDIDGEATGDESGWSVSLSSDGSIVAIGAPRNDGNGSISGQVRIYKNESGVWTQIGSDIDGEATFDYSGYSISLSSDGSIVAIGAPGNSWGGHVRVFKNVNDIWTQVGSDIYGEATGDEAGKTVSLSSDGNVVAIGAPRNDGNGNVSGHVRIYKNESNVWTQIGSDIDGETDNDYSGSSISLSSDGSIVAIGTPYNDGNGVNSGHVRIYKNESDVWTQIGSDIDGENEYDYSGWSISLSNDGSIVAIGVLYGYGGGPYPSRVRIYKNESGIWTQAGIDIVGETTYDSSGWSVSLSSDGSFVGIGAILNIGTGTSGGHVRVYDLLAVLTTDSYILSDFSMFPNPVTETLTITLKSNFDLEKVNIYSTLGQLVISEISNTINVKDLPQGTYYVQVSTNYGKATKIVFIE